MKLVCRGCSASCASGLVGKLEGAVRFGVGVHRRVQLAELRRWLTQRVLVTIPGGDMLDEPATQQSQKKSRHSGCDMENSGDVAVGCCGLGRRTGFCPWVYLNCLGCR